jgi:hypothetical protein
MLQNNFTLQKLVIVTKQSRDSWRQEGKSQQTMYYVNVEYTLFSTKQQASVSGSININNHLVGQQIYKTQRRILCQQYYSFP